MPVVLTKSNGMHFSLSCSNTKSAESTGHSSQFWRLSTIRMCSPRPSGMHHPSLWYHEHLLISPKYIYTKQLISPKQVYFGLFPSCPWSAQLCHRHRNWIWKKRCYVTIELYTAVPTGPYLAVKSRLLFKQGGAFRDLSVVCLWLTSAPPGSPCGLGKCKGFSLVSKCAYGAWGFLRSPLADERILLHNCDIGSLYRSLLWYAGTHAWQPGLAEVEP